MYELVKKYFTVNGQNYVGILSYDEYPDDPINYLCSCPKFYRKGRTVSDDFDDDAEVEIEVDGEIETVRLSLYDQVQNLRKLGAICKCQFIADNGYIYDCENEDCNAVFYIPYETVPYIEDNCYPNIQETFEQDWHEYRLYLEGNVYEIFCARLIQDGEVFHKDGTIIIGDDIIDSDTIENYDGIISDDSYLNILENQIAVLYSGYSIELDKDSKAI